MCTLCTPPPNPLWLLQTDKYRNYSANLQRQTQFQKLQQLTATNQRWCLYTQRSTVRTNSCELFREFLCCSVDFLLSSWFSSSDSESFFVRNWVALNKQSKKGKKASEIKNIWSRSIDFACSNSCALTLQNQTIGYTKWCAMRWLWFSSAVSCTQCTRSHDSDHSPCNSNDVAQAQCYR